MVLLKFLRARDFRVRDAHAMLLRCAAWRAEFSADAVLDEHLGFKKRVLARWSLLTKEDSSIMKLIC